MSSGPKYGHILGDGHGARMALTTTNYFNEKGGHFVYNNSGSAALATSSSSYLIGWAETGKLYGYGANYFVSTSTSDALVIPAGTDDVYRVPAGSAVTTSDRGKKYKITYSGATTTLIQQVDNDGTDYQTAQLYVYDVDQDDIDNQTLQVKLLAANPAS